MSKKLNNMKWSTVALEGIPIEAMTQKFDGFVGLEECKDYGFEKENKKSKQKQKPKKRKSKTSLTEIQAVVPSKKVRLSNGFVVETCTEVKPSLTNNTNSHPQKGKDKKPKTKTIKITKAKLGENLDKSKSISVQEMEHWAEYQIPEEIIKALAEQGFKKPTTIQELTLPAAVLGRRDILGAAETGSGKTLAFGIPILAGIMKLKEKAQLGQDVYDFAYKKTSTKKKAEIPVIEKKSKGKKKIKTNKESSEEGYSSGESDDEHSENNNQNSVTEASDDQHSDNEISDNQSSDNEMSDNQNSDDENSEGFLEEYDVPIKRKQTNDEIDGNDSDDDENYTHLSDMIDSDDFDATSDEEEQNDDVNNTEDRDSENQHDGANGTGGIGCVKVIDNVELPGHVAIKTGKPLYALILTPTRELAMQVSRHLISAAKYTGIRIATVVGGMASVKQERVLSKSPEVVVATPGRLWELIRQGQQHLQQLDDIKFLAIDETDRMVERNHFLELHPLLERINADEKKRQSRQNFVFSATLTLVHDLPDHMKGKKVTKRGKIINRKLKKMTSQQKVKKLVDLVGMTDPKVVDITTKNLGTAETLTECRIVCSLEEKDYYLFYVLKRHPGRTIVFCNSIGSVKRLAQLFGLLKCSPLPLHASMPQRQRLKNLERFRDDPHGVLVSTDVAARGLDIPDVDHVIHYQVPRTAENYVHRSGRTARAHKEGLTILMLEPGEAMTYSKLCKTLNKQSEIPSFPVPTHILNSMKSIVKLAREVDRLLLGTRRSASEQGWLDKAAKDMDMIVDEDFVQTKPRDTTAIKALNIKKKQLEALLSKPIFPKGFSFKYPTLNTHNNCEKNEENALQVMKNAIQSGEVKKNKRIGKNSSVLSLEKNLRNK